ncbi:hypothetical protein [Streptomyces pulveraceus]|uniref:Uncharacterized protein n=1 Tax=Streptomyces pulveraceus TaxID=68258 RepID=A0ABW1GLG2_9ACTN
MGSASAPAFPYPLLLGLTIVSGLLLAVVAPESVRVPAVGSVLVGIGPGRA